MAVRKRVKERVEYWRDRITGPEPRTPIIPWRDRGWARNVSFEWGEAYGETAGEWYRVDFDRVLVNAKVVCVARARAGSLIKRNIPRIQLPDLGEIPQQPMQDLKDIPRFWLEWWWCTDCDFAWLSIPGVSRTTCPSCGGGNIEECTLSRKECAKQATHKLYWWGAKIGLGDWTWLEAGDWLDITIAGYGIVIPPWDVSFNWARNLVIAAFEWVGTALGRVLWALWEVAQSQIDQVQASLWESLEDSYDVLTAQVEKIRTFINEGIITEFNAVQDQVDEIQVRANEILDDLYDSWGVEKGTILTPVHVRNVNSSGFEFQSYGDTTIYYIAVGRRPGSSESTLTK